MAYLLNIETSQVQELYKKILSTFKNNYLSSTYYDDYLNRVEFKNEEHFDEIIDNFLKKYHWAVFSYFTTYHTKHITFVTNEKEIFDKYLKCMSYIDKSHFNIYSHKDTKSILFNTLTFDDYGTEGKNILKLSKELDKKNPYFICYIDPKIEYYRYDYETTEFEDFIWYEDEVRALKEVRRFFSKFGEYIIFEVTDKVAYFKIWEMASCDENIAEFVISNNSDLDLVETILKQDNYYKNWEEFKEEPSISWIYTQVYGGGSDEHHAIFYAKEARYTDTLASYLDKDKWFSRY